MSSTNTSTAQKVPMGQKIAFGIGMLANQMFPAVMGIFMVVLVQDLGFPGWMWGFVFFFPRIFDSFTDPIMGFISDNTKSRWGRRRQYVFLGAIIMGISFSFLWQLYKLETVDYNFAYFLAWSFIFYLGLTIFSVPYVAMGYEMSDDFHERTNIMAVSQWIGQWAWVIAPWFWVIMYDPDWFSSAEVATRTLAVWVGVIFMLCAMVPAIFIKSKSTLNEDYTPMTFKTIGGSLKKILHGFLEAFSIKPFRKLCIATFFIFNAFNTVASFTFFVIVYHLFSGDAAAANAGYWPSLFGCIGALMTTFLVIPIVSRLSKKLGKKRAFLISQGISIIGYILLWFLLIPGRPYMFIFALPFFSFGIGSLFMLMMSMTADVIDLDELNTGKRREGIFGAIYWLMVKFGFAIAGLASGTILSYIGFDSALEIQPDGAITGLRLFFSGLPIVGTLIAITVMWNYDVTEEKADEISAQLKARKAAKNPISPSFFQTNKLQTIVALSPEDKLVTDLDSKNTVDLKTYFKESLNSGLHGICFSPYLEGQNIGDTISKKQINQRMDLIAPHTKWIRSFSCSDGNEYIPVSANQRGLKTMTGAWIGKDKIQNDKEIDALIKLAQDGQVDIAVVGNEALMREDLSEAELLAYIYRVKEALPDIPVGYVDAYFQFHERPKLVEACDVILANCYPFWEGCPIDQATVYLNQMYLITQLAAKGKPVIITETGWPNEGTSTEGAVPSDDKAMQYFINVNNWAKSEGINLFYFSSFDESWKVHQEGNVGARWGIWDKNEKLKYQ
jgi:GPH family glycoside/pentoside/hexuronide:cation symporter